MPESDALPLPDTPQPAPPPRSRRRRLLFKLLIAAALLLPLCALGLVAAELAARNFYKGAWGFLQEDRELGWVYVPNREGVAVFPDEGGFSRVPARINSLGFHDREFKVEKAPGVTRIVILGDSYVEGMQVPLDKMFPRLLEDRLNAGREGRPYEVIAAGHTNYGPDQELGFYRREIRKLKPDIVVQVLFPMNDFSDVSFELNDRLFYPKPFHRLGADGVMTLDKEPVLTPRTLQVRHLNIITRFLSRFMAYQYFVEHIRRYDRSFADLLQKCKLIKKLQVVTPGGWPLVSEVHLAHPDKDWQHAFEIVRRLVGMLKTDVEADGAKFYGVVVPFTNFFRKNLPGHAEVYWPELISNKDMTDGLPERRALDVFADVGAPSLDLMGPLTDAWEREKKEQGEKAVFPYLVYDGHWTSVGHEAAAEGIEAFLKAQGAVN